MGGNEPYVNPYPGETNPFPTETKTNADAPWLDGGPPLKVKPKGLRAYAKHMVDQELDMGTRRGHLSHLTTTPNDGWTGDVLGEAAAVRSTVTNNALEFFAYLEKLGTTLHNVGMAAQTVADSYEANDAMSAASMNSVLFAFGENVPRPAGLPRNIGQTYWEQQANAKGEPLGADSGLWVDGDTKQMGPYQTIQTSTGPNGERREVVTTNIPGGGTTVTTTVYNAKNKIVTQSSNRTTVTYDSRTNTQVTTSSSYDAKGKLTGSTKESTTYTATGDVSSRVNDTNDDTGALTNRRTTTVDAKTETTTEKSEKVVLNDKDHPKAGTHLETTDLVATGKQTQGQVGVTETIASEYDPYTKEVTG
ncbi:hypothetical protein [Actinoplanes sp. L3-i22]|uniref:hypothetical protein n=1 Tax=Actinoplanes sp. L3-i22 TaxID=2836373 RepID=UPI001C79029C|nr:hypothetical protein [Actinoplanes sp. L3-i22]BCY06435.1 hypothetical protein L3i22_015230 [Actinoplanes sp. L3-i22]